MFQVHTNVEWSKLRGADVDKGRNVLVKELEAGDKSRAAQQSLGMLTFEGPAV